MSMHILMYPWFAYGHLTPFLHLSNKLASGGHTISFLHPPNTLPFLQPLNLYPRLISFVSVPVPNLPGLPPGTETTAGIPLPLVSLLMDAMDLTKPTLDAHLRRLRPHLVVFDFAHWLPALCRPLGIKSLHYCTVSAATIGYLLSPSRGPVTDYSHLKNPPPGFPPFKINLKTHEARGLFSMPSDEKQGTISFEDRQMESLTDCDSIAFRTVREVDGLYCDYIESQFNKPVFLTGPVLPPPPTTTLDETLKNWLDRFESKIVIYCAFGSECVLKESQFQELLLGLDLAGKPFLAALKPPSDNALQSALSERGLVYGGWVQQQLILTHPSVGCFVTHCGSGSLWEALATECQLVLVPHKGDQFINARVMGGDLKVGVEVEIGDEDGEFTRDGVCEAVKSVMDEESEIGKTVRTNHDKIRELLVGDGFETSCFDSFVQKLQHLAREK